MKRIGLALVAVLCVSIAAFAGTVITNDTGEDATGLRVTFSSPVLITTFGDTLTTVDQTSLSYEFVFSGGTVKPGDSQWFSYAPATASVVSTEWLTGTSAQGEQVRAPNWQQEFEDVIGPAFDRSSTDGIGGSILIPNLGIQSEDLQMRYTTFLELLKRNTGNELEAVSTPESIIGPVDTLHHGWGNQITVYVGREYNGTSQWVEEVIDELNAGIDDVFLKKVSTPNAQWVFDYSGVDYRNDRSIDAKVTLSAVGDPVSCQFSVSGLFVYVDDFKTRLRKAIARTLLLYDQYDPALLAHLGYATAYFEKTGFSQDLLNVVSVLRHLPDGRDFSMDLNEVNRSPIAKLPDAIEVYVGDSVLLDSSSSIDPDGVIASVHWDQQYATQFDVEYVTNQVAALDSSTAAKASFTPAWPGNYRFQLTVADNSGATNSAHINVRVFSKAPLLGIEGVCAFAYWDPSGLTSFIPRILDDLVARGVEWLEFAPLGWMKDGASNNVERLGEYYAGCPGFTISDEQLSALVGMCHERGLKVFLRPTIENYRWLHWRGDLKPTDWSSWFASYTEWILHYARLASTLGVEMFDVFNELNNAMSQTASCREVVRAVDEVLPANTILTLSDAGLPWGISKVDFWDEPAIDHIGVDFYYQITGSGEYWDTGVPRSDNPPFWQYIASIRRGLANIHEVSIEIGKMVVIHESGWGNSFASNYGIGGGWIQDVGYESSIVDNTQPVKYLEALFQVVAENPWIDGAFVFVRAFKADFNYQKEDLPVTHDIAGHPAGDMLQYWYMQEAIPQTTPATSDDAEPVLNAPLVENGARSIGTTPQAIEVIGDMAYVIDWSDGGLYASSLDGSAIQLLSHGFGHVSDMASDGDILFIVDESGMAWSYDIEASSATTLDLGGAVEGETLGLEYDDGSLFLLQYGSNGPMIQEVTDGEVVSFPVDAAGAGELISLQMFDGTLMSIDYGVGIVYRLVLTGDVYSLEPYLVLSDLVPRNEQADGGIRGMYLTDEVYYFTSISNSEAPGKLHVVDVSE